MNNPYKQYEVELEVIGPVHVGSGIKLSKKSYVFSDNRHIEIIDLEKMYLFLKRKGLAAKYEQYLVEKDRMKLKDWLNRNRIQVSDIADCIKYRIDCGDAINQDNNDMQILEHIKDPYGMPYIPGSSLKGMLRTILLASDILDNTEKYSYAGRELLNNIGKRENRNRYLNKDIKNIETAGFNTLSRSDKINEAVNDYMAGIIVSDSEAIDIRNMVLCGKIEGHVDGNEHKINIMRECIKPGTIIRFTITIDETLWKKDKKYEDYKDVIYHAVENFSECYNNCFVSSFRNAKSLKSDYVVLGGGSGFVSKTIMYPLYGKRYGVKYVNNILMNTIAREKNGKHKNGNDISEGVSPHIIKYTRYNGQKLQLGICKITIK